MAQYTWVKVCTSVQLLFVKVFIMVWHSELTTVKHATQWCFSVDSTSNCKSLSGSMHTSLQSSDLALIYTWHEAWCQRFNLGKKCKRGVDTVWMRVPLSLTSCWIDPSPNLQAKLQQLSLPSRSQGILTVAWWAVTILVLDRVKHSLPAKRSQKLFNARPHAWNLLDHGQA